MKFFKKLEKLGRLQAILLALVQISVLGVIDFYTGFELSFSVFYLIPVAFTAWYSEKNPALIVSLTSAVVWEFSNLLAGETYSYVLISIWNASTRLCFFLVVALLLTKLKDSYVHQKALAQTDFLTGAANARAFYKAVEMEISRSRRYDRIFTVCYLDADNFKQVNDTLGHNVGSDLLVRVVKILKQNLRSTDLVGRLGGDEFAVLLPETDKYEAKTVVEKIRAALGAGMRSERWAVTFSIGVATFTELPEKVDDVIKFADNLMYEVKRNSKNSAKFDEFGNRPEFVDGAK